MSTQINVTVGSGGLSDKAKQLQAAARQAQLEKERTAQIEADGTEQRNARLAANGQAPDGSALYGVPTAVPFIERRPAANRPAQDVGPGTFWQWGSNTTFNFLGPNGWVGTNQSNPTGTIQNSAVNASQSIFDFYVTCGSGKQSEIISLNFDAQQSVFVPGASTFLAMYEGYEERGDAPGTYFLRQKSYMHIHETAVSTVRSSTSFDFAILPTGGANAILIVMGRQIAGQSRYTMGGFYNETFDSSSSFVGYFPAQPSPGVITVHSQTSQSGTFSVRNSSGVLESFSVPKRVSAYSINLGYSEVFRAFAINKDKMREITFPNELKSKILAAYPLQYTTDTLRVGGSTEDFTATDYIYFPYLGSWGALRVNASSGFQQSVAIGPGGGGSQNVIGSATPEIYKVINQSISFTDPSNILEYNFEQNKAVVQDRTSGMFSPYANASCTGNSTFSDTSTQTGIKNYFNSFEFIDFGFWPVAGQTPDYSVFNTLGCPITPELPPIQKIPKARTKMAPSRPTPPLPFGFPYGNLIAIYDAGQPSYCKAMCRALGFTDADLKP